MLFQSIKSLLSMPLRHQHTIRCCITAPSWQGTCISMWHALQVIPCKGLQGVGAHRQGPLGARRQQHHGERADSIIQVAAGADALHRVYHGSVEGRHTLGAPLAAQVHEHRPRHIHLLARLLRPADMQPISGGACWCHASAHAWLDVPLVHSPLAYTKVGAQHMHAQLRSVAWMAWWAARPKTVCEESSVRTKAGGALAPPAAG